MADIKPKKIYQRKKAQYPVQLDAETHERLRIMSYRYNTKMNKVVSEALKLYEKTRIFG